MSKHQSDINLRSARNKSHTRELSVGDQISDGRLSEVDFVLKEEEQTDYDDPGRRLLFAHEKDGKTIIE